MKQEFKLSVVKLFLVLVLNIFVVSAWAQETNESGGETKTTTTTTKSTDINVTTDAGDTWYTQPWVWIVGAAVFILLLVALLSGSKGRDTVSTTDRVTVKKTVERDTGTDV